MKNFKINEELKTRIISGGLSLILVATGFGLGKLDSKQNGSDTNGNTNSTIDVDNYLADYITKRDALEEEIESLEVKKERLQDIIYYSIDRLIVIEYETLERESTLYILKEGSSCDYFYDYKSEILAHHAGVCDIHPGAIHFTDYQPLFNYLNDEEMEILINNEGRFSNLELDKILTRIRAEYQQQKLEESYTRSLTK